MDSNSFIALPALNFSEKYQFRLKKDENRTYVFCILRKMWLVLTPEEWVRQHMIHELHSVKKYPLHSLVAEHPVMINGLKQWMDILIYQNQQPLLLCECKKPGVAITQATVNQTMRYASEIRAEYIVLTNGMQHFCFRVDHRKRLLEELKEIPAYSLSSP